MKVELLSQHQVIETIDVSVIDAIFIGKSTAPDIIAVDTVDRGRLYCDELSFNA